MLKSLEDDALRAFREEFGEWCGAEVAGPDRGSLRAIARAGDYMADSFIGEAYVDARVQRIFRGPTEVLKELIGRHAV